MVFDTKLRLNLKVPFETQLGIRKPFKTKDMKNAEIDEKRLRDGI